jgi:hypothetical protein
MAQNMKRGRNQRRRPHTNVNRALDSTGPEVKIRGTALQIYDKYQALARDASSSGDRIRAESLQQHAEHYYRVLKAIQPPQQQQPQHQQNQNQQQQDQGGGPQPEVASDQAQDKSETADAGDAATTEADVSPDVAEASTVEAGQAEAASGAEDEKPKRTRRRRPARKSASSEGDASNGEKEVATVK